MEAAAGKEKPKRRTHHCEKSSQFADQLKKANQPKPTNSKQQPKAQLKKRNFSSRNITISSTTSLMLPNEQLW